MAMPAPFETVHFQNERRIDLHVVNAATDKPVELLPAQCLLGNQRFGHPLDAGSMTPNEHPRLGAKARFDLWPPFAIVEFFGHQIALISIFVAFNRGRRDVGRVYLSPAHVATVRSLRVFSLVILHSKCRNATHENNY